MAILGLDFGKKRIGLALTKAGFLVERYKTIDNNDRVFESLAEICEKEDIEKIVVGLPLGIDFQKGESYKVAKEFGEKLKKELDVEIEFFDEAFSSTEGKERLEKEGVKSEILKNLIDQESAKIILEDYLKIDKK